MAKVSAYGRFVVVEVQRTLPLPPESTTMMREIRRFMSDNKVLRRLDFRAADEARWRTGTWTVANGNRPLTCTPADWRARKVEHGWTVVYSKG